MKIIQPMIIEIEEQVIVKKRYEHVRTNDNDDDCVRCDMHESNCRKVPCGAGYFKLVPDTDF